MQSLRIYIYIMYVHICACLSLASFPMTRPGNEANLSPAVNHLRLLLFVYLHHVTIRNQALERERTVNSLATCSTWMMATTKTETPGDLPIHWLE